jgi:hypothetical protein
MKPASGITHPIDDLLSKVLDSTLDDDEQELLAELLRRDPQARRLYHEHITLHALLHWKETDGSADVSGAASAGRPCLQSDIESRISEVPSPGLPVPGPEPLIPPIILDLSSTLPRTPGLFAPGGWLFSYAAATVITGVVILGTWAHKVSVSRDYQFAGPSSPPAVPEPTPEYVGRIIGMADCQWADPRTIPPSGAAAVPVGGKYALNSGLIEIAYQTGAKVILQGPCTYEVDSPSGGFLSLGKLTARVEKSEIRNPKSEGSSSFILHPSSLFIVRTPTAVVTDLGTEFGVEVNKEGDTTSYVFRGSVRMQSGDGQHPIVLRRNESARAERDGAAGGVRVVRRDAAGVPPAFVRQLREPPKLLDLLDIVAGGDGTGRHRERGIDPTSGMEEVRFAAEYRWGNHQYYPVHWNSIRPISLIDGVFAPDGGPGPVVLDSAGHTFDGFPQTYGNVYGSIWARAAAVKAEGHAKDSAFWLDVLGPAAQFMPEGRGLLGLHANAAITFSLEAMRTLHRGVRPARFRATAGLGDAHRLLPEDPGNEIGSADIWVFVDGRLKLKRTYLRPKDGTVNVDVELGPNDRFLTLASTDAGNGPGYDWVVFGDPLLEMAATGLEPLPDHDQPPPRKETIP